MERISRRSFTRRVAAVSLLPVLAARSRAQIGPPPLPGPDAIAGYIPDDAEREAMNRFIAEQEKEFATVRAIVLSNDAAPATVFRTMLTAEQSKHRKSPDGHKSPEN
jgi:hypothetical protein